MTSTVDSTPTATPDPPTGAAGRATASAPPAPPVPLIAPPDADLGPAAPAPRRPADEAADRGAPAPPRRSSSPPPAFPPPSPGTDAGSGGIRPWVRRWLLAIVALQLAAVFAVLWIANRGAAEDARGQRDAAIAERNAAEAAADDLELQLDSAAAAQASAEAALASAEADLAAAQADLAAAQSNGAESSAEAEALAEQIPVLETRVAELTAERDQLLAAAAAAAAEADAAAPDAATPDAAAPDAATPDAATPDAAAEDAAAETPAPASTPESPPTFDVTDAPEFSRYIGEQLSDRPGGSVLGAGQAECFGAAVIADIGLDAIGAGERSGAGGDARATVDDAKGRAAASCGIDPSAVA